MASSYLLRPLCTAHQFYSTQSSEDRVCRYNSLRGRRRVARPAFVLPCRGDFSLLSVNLKSSSARINGLNLSQGNFTGQANVVADVNVDAQLSDALIEAQHLSGASSAVSSGSAAPGPAADPGAEFDYQVYTANTMIGYKPPPPPRIPLGGPFEDYYDEYVGVDYVLKQEKPTSSFFMFLESLSEKRAEEKAKLREKDSSRPPFNKHLFEEVPSMYAKFEPTEAEDSDTESEQENDREESTVRESLVNSPKRQTKGRARIKGLMNDFGVMEREIRDFIAAYGMEGIMPMRKNLRQRGRSDLEKAIRAMGGFSTVAARMKLSLSYKERKPFGYWDDVQNLRNEVIAAQKESGCDPAVLPSRLSIERLGKYGLARALEKWGGAKETARILGLKAKSLKKSERHRKEGLSSKDSGLAPFVKPQLPVDPTALCNMVVDQGSLAVKKPFEADVAEEFSPESYLRSVASYIEEASELSSRKDEVSSPSSTSEDLSQQASTKGNCNPLANDRASVDSDSVSASQVKDKKLPFKTGVPQESSKWLTLFVDVEQLDG